MSALSDAGRRGQERMERLVERLLDALTNPARRERTVAPTDHAPAAGASAVAPCACGPIGRTNWNRAPVLPSEAAVSLPP